MQSLARRAEPNTPGKRRRLGRFDVLGVVSLLAFAATLWSGRSGLLEAQPEVSLHLDPQALAEGFREGTAWHGLYRDGAKVGFSRTQRRRADDGYENDHTLVLPVVSGEGLQTLHVRTELDATFTLARFSADATGGPIDVAARGSWADGVLSIVVEGLPGGALTQELPMPEAPQMDQSFLPLASRDDLKAGDRFTFTHFDPLSASPSKATVVVVGTESLDLLGDTVQALRLRQEIGGQLLDVWVNELGEVLQQTLPGGLTAKRESEAQATWGVLIAGAPAQWGPR
ncbi:MAG: hypothetical protein AAF721_34805 [Myxococcota bacterium]